ncbi:Acid sphingomyelinase-like phosphodiesterase 3b [Thoreauomyces humboldtii]|nr:Acid sphingomyelinase-like phosphodiesterase 3b [Thoreauomyces humboldtii]
MRSAILFTAAAVAVSPLLLASANPTPVSPVEASSGRSRHQQQKNFVHITDVHYDPFYVARSDVKTQCHRIQENVEPIQRAAHYGTRGSNCDSPLALVTDAFASLQADVAQHRALDVVFWTGDSSRHDRDNLEPKDEAEVYSQNAEVIYFLTKTFDLTTTIIVPAVGNWDVFPHNTIYDAPVAGLAKLYETWKPLLESGLGPEDVNRTLSSFLQGGWFDRTVAETAGTPTVRAFSMNTVYWLIENLGVPDCAVYTPDEKPIASTHSADTQLAWLWTELANARSLGQKVVLIGHIPPIDSTDAQLYKPQCFQWFLQLTGEFSDVILTQYYGHVNKDIVNLVLKPKEKKTRVGTTDPRYLFKAVTPMSLPYIDTSAYQVIGNFKTSASFVPVHNPGLRAGKLTWGGNENAANASASIIEESQWYADVSHANERYAASPGASTFRFKEACRTVEDYGMPAILNSTSYTDWVRRMQAELADPEADLDVDGYGTIADTGAEATRKKHRRTAFEAYALCIDSNEKAPRPVKEAKLYLSPAAVRAVLISAVLAFIASLGGFFLYVRRLERSGTEAERQRLLFREGRGG